MIWIAVLAGLVVGCYLAWRKFKQSVDDNYWKVLCCMTRFDCSMRPSDIATRLSVGTGTTIAVLKRLAREGYVSKSSAASDAEDFYRINHEGFDLIRQHEELLRAHDMYPL